MIFVLRFFFSIYKNCRTSVYTYIHNFIPPLSSNTHTHNIHFQAIEMYAQRKTQSNLYSSYVCTHFCIYPCVLCFRSPHACFKLYHKVYTLFCLSNDPQGWSSDGGAAGWLLYMRINSSAIINLKQLLISHLKGILASQLIFYREHFKSKLR